ncbi:2-dehydro-3-deoxygalactonokinase [uncultured Sphingomonas sp.]|uniref:2-dehydro-3-deoxygalactonokinase n=1 Tax=uncultured Sphingomonas sp. TaxID=158754 RepID=UPI0025D86B97|nr:2-dehydro-3-deoxygalactonokinase [uncultured Sphingomonas sp.]
MAGDYIVIDWGTTNRRAWRVGADGVPKITSRNARGVLSVPPDGYPAEIGALRDELGALPIIAAGMVGSNRGWHEVPYVDAPADLRDLARGCVTLADEDVVLVPGVALRGEARADVMRGEEVQVLGAIAAGLAPADALFCQPGTHNKWIATTAGRITDVATALTGELFALLRGHGILAGMLDGAVTDGAAFRDGVARGAGARDLTVALFEVRARVLLGRLAADDAAAFASGVLIGADVGARDDLTGRTVQLLAGGALAELYAAAIGQCGGAAIALNSERAFLAGIQRLWELTR